MENGDEGREKKEEDKGGVSSLFLDMKGGQWGFQSDDLLEFPGVEEGVGNHGLGRDVGPREVLDLLVKLDGSGVEIDLPSSLSTKREEKKR